MLNAMNQTYPAVMVIHYNKSYLEFQTECQKHANLLSRRFYHPQDITIQVDDHDKQHDVFRCYLNPRNFRRSFAVGDAAAAAAADSGAAADVATPEKNTTTTAKKPLVKRNWTVVWTVNTREHTILQTIPQALRTSNNYLNPYNDHYQTKIPHRLYDIADTKGSTDVEINTRFSNLVQNDFVELSLFGNLATLTVTNNGFQLESATMKHHYHDASSSSSSSSSQRVLLSTAPLAGIKLAYAHQKDIIYRHAWMHLPEFLSDDLWKRHNYSMNDVKKTLEFLPDRMVWQFLILQNLSIVDAASSVTSDTYQTIQCNAKTNAITKIMTHLSKRWSDWKDRTDVTWDITWLSKLDRQKSNGINEAQEPILHEHFPILPTHQLSYNDYSDIAKHDNNTKIWQWRGIDIIIRERYESNHLLLMTRVMLKSLYLKEYPDSDKYISSAAFHLKPLMINGLEFILMDEAFYLFAHPPPSSSSSSSSTTVSNKRPKLCIPTTV